MCTHAICTRFSQVSNRIPLQLVNAAEVWLQVKMMSPEAAGTIRSSTTIRQVFNCLSQCGSSNLALNSTRDLTSQDFISINIKFSFEPYWQFQ